MGSGDTRYFPF